MRIFGHTPIHGAETQGSRSELLTQLLFPGTEIRCVFLHIAVAQLEGLGAACSSTLETPLKPGDASDILRKVNPNGLVMSLRYVGGLLTYCYACL